MVEDGIPEDHENGSSARCGDLFWRCRAYPFGPSCGAQLGKKGETPIVETTGARHAMSLISAITSKGHMRFMVKEKGGVNAGVFIEFLKRLLIGAKHTIFLIVDRGPAHRAQKTRDFFKILGGKLIFFSLP